MMMSTCTHGKGILSTSTCPYHGVELYNLACNGVAKMNKVICHPDETDEKRARSADNAMGPFGSKATYRAKSTKCAARADNTAASNSSTPSLTLCASPQCSLFIATIGRNVIYHLRAKSTRHAPAAQTKRHYSLTPPAPLRTDPSGSWNPL